MSSATLFFGPSIPQSENRAGHRSNSSSSKASFDSTRMNLDPPNFTSNRHSYAGSTTSSTCDWGKASTRPRSGEVDDDEAQFFLGGSPDSAFTFALTGETPSPKKKQRMDPIEMLPKKFNPRDSGIALDESDDGGDGDGREDFPRSGSVGMGMPAASTSVSTMNSESDGEALVTPGFVPGPGSGWPGIVDLDDEDEEDELSTRSALRTNHLVESPRGTTLNTGDRSVDAFIMRTLTAGSKPAQKAGGDMRPPGTPVKRLKTTHHLMDRPWQSAVASKIGFPEFDEAQRLEKLGRPKPRKSLPAVFPFPLGSGVGGKPKVERHRKDALNFGGVTMPSQPLMLPPSGILNTMNTMSMDLEGDDEEASPTLKRDPKYDGLGLGRPSFTIPAFAKPGVDGKGKPSWLMRRSSSGAFSSGSETCTSGSATPTRLMPRGIFPLFSTAHARLLKMLFIDLPSLQTGIPGATSLSSAATSATSTGTNSPTIAAVSRHLPVTNLFAQYRRGQNQQQPTTSPKKNSLLASSSTLHHHHQQSSSRTHFGFLRTRRSMAFGEEQTGRFERDFIEIDELGRGEFGRVMKARYKQGSKEVFAVKKAKRFEGVKHRYVLFFS